MFGRFKQRSPKLGNNPDVLQWLNWQTDQHLPTRKYYSAVKKTELLTQETTWWFLVVLFWVKGAVIWRSLLCNPDLQEVSSDRGKASVHQGGRWKEVWLWLHNQRWNDGTLLWWLYKLPTHITIHRTVQSTFPKAKSYCVKTEKINKQKTYMEHTSDLKIQISGHIGPCQWPL